MGRERNWIDFDDLIVLTVELLERDEAIAQSWRSRFAHILADEFQDVDEQQYRLLRLLAGRNGNLCVIGDPNQAIYGFRGADSTCFARFATDFPDARTLRLNRNYRSTGTIVKASSALVGMPAEGITRPMQEPIALHVAASEDDEADFVAETIEALMGGHDLLTANRGKAAKGGALSFADFAVLYRTDAQSAALRTMLDRAGIPFKKSSPQPLAGHAGVEAILAGLTEHREALAGLELSSRIAAAAQRAADADIVAITEAKAC
jgi:superfamily I DNA/RNA helicase